MGMYFVCVVLSEAGRSCTRRRLSFAWRTNPSRAGTQPGFTTGRLIRATSIWTGLRAATDQATLLPELNGERLQIVCRRAGPPEPLFCYALGSTKVGAGRRGCVVLTEAPRQKAPTSIESREAPDDS